MLSVSLCFRLHLPLPLRPYSFFDLGRAHQYIDTARRSELLERAVRQCYLPANRLMLELIERHEGDFRLAFALSGSLLDQLQQHAPEVVDSFRKLLSTGCVELLGMPEGNSLSYLVDRSIFTQQVKAYEEKVQKLFGHLPRVLYNTELIYNNHLAYLAWRMGYQGVMVQGEPVALRGRSPWHLYEAPDMPDFALFLRARELSEALNDHFSDPAWPAYPLDAGSYAGWLLEAAAGGELVNLMLDYEALGMYHPEHSGIFEFVRHFPGHVIASGGARFVTPAEARGLLETRGSIDFSGFRSLRGDISTWTGNAMQEEALEKLFALKDQVAGATDPRVQHDWQLLQAAEHFAAMHTPAVSPPEATHPYQSPYNAYIYYMNALADLELRLKAVTA